MATYVIGDVHGCFAELQLLLAEFAFNPLQDTLWFTGDLINGGPQSVETLQFIHDLGERAICVLGNHDLTLLGMAAKKITFKIEQHGAGYLQILADKRVAALIPWLQSRKLSYYSPTFKILLVHAGVAPQWTIEQTLGLAGEVEAVLQNPSTAADFFANMFGNEPATWSDNLTGLQRLRCITNHLTRIRFCDLNGTMDLLNKGDLDSKADNMLPWYSVPWRTSRHTKIIFGHWAALQGKTEPQYNVVALDTGCMWGNYLSAMRLDDGRMFRVKSQIAASN